MNICFTWVQVVADVSYVFFNVGKYLNNIKFFTLLKQASNSHSFIFMQIKNTKQQQQMFKHKINLKLFHFLAAIKEKKNSSPPHCLF